MTSGDKSIYSLLADAGDEEALLDSRILEEELQGEALLLAAARRAKGEPLAYILGHRHFYKEDYKVTPDVLIPRSDSELLVESALMFTGALDIPTGDVLKIPSGDIGDALSFADFCTGSGCVGISVFNELTRKGIKATGILTDISDGALTVTRENISNLALKDGLSAIKSDILKDDPVLEGLDFITANPPYISDCEMRELDRDISLYEPHLALRADMDGLEFYPQVFSKAYKALREGGMVFAEHGYMQGERVRQICIDAGFVDVMTLKDYGGNDRVTLGRKYAG